jgi:hypothetical protein
LQLYFIAAWLFGASGALDAHKNVGGFVVHPFEILTFVAALIGWWGVWRNVLWSLALPVVGTVQIFFVGDLKDPGNGWVHGLHGGLVLVVAALARSSLGATGLRLGFVARSPRRLQQPAGLPDGIPSCLAASLEDVF